MDVDSNDTIIDVPAGDQVIAELVGANPMMVYL